MGFLGLIFWVLVIWAVVGLMRGRRWGCWSASAGTRDARDADDLDRRLSYEETLERRVAELEERLDFTERLLASRPAPRDPARDTPMVETR